MTDRPISSELKRTPRPIRHSSGIPHVLLEGTHISDVGDRARSLRIGTYVLGEVLVNVRAPSMQVRIARARSARSNAVIAGCCRGPERKAESSR